jgi:putative ABC transport system permease protein
MKIRSLRAALIRLSGAVSRGPRERALADELDSHIQLHIDDNIRAGLTPAEARRQALLRLGGIDQTKERYRDRASLPWLETALQDLRGSARLMRRTPGFTTVALLTLAIGIGANTVMFSVVNTVLLRPLPYADADRLWSVQALGQDGARLTTAPPDFYTLRDRTSTLDFLEAHYNGAFNLTDSEDAERLPGLIVSSGFFDALGTPPALGRGFVAADEQWGSHRVVVLTDGLWKRRFGASSAVVGQTVMLNAQHYTVVGVLPPAFSFLGRDVQVFVPMAFEAGDNMNSHNNYFLSMFGRVKRDVSRATAAADLNRVCEEIIREQPLNAGMSIGLSPLREVLVRDVRRSVLVLLGAVGFVLLISCANLANLLLARGAVREREIAVRTAIGATRLRLLRQLLTESVALATTGGLAGLALAYVSVDGLNLLSQRVLPRAEAIRIDAVVIAFTFAAALLTGILFGLVPALKTSAANLNGGLKDGAGTASAGAASHRLGAALVVAEVALSLVLLIGAGLMVKSMYRLLNVDAGFNPDGVLTMQISLSRQRYVAVQLERQFSPLAYTRAIRFFTETIASVRELPEVRAAGAINGLPLMGEVWGKNLTWLDRPLPSQLRDLPSYQYRVVVGDYFRAMGIRILNGRAFEDSDTQDALPVVIVNREAARRFWNGENPLGKVVSLNPPLEIVPEALVRQARLAGLPEDYVVPTFTVIGVVADVRDGGLTSPAAPTVYAPYAQASEGTTNMFLAVRADGDPLTLVAAIRERMRQIDPNQPLANIQTMETRLATSVSQRRIEMIVLAIFAAAAMLLAAIGIYGVMSYWVAQRKQEIGIRMALGAERQQVVMLVLRQSAVMLALGLVTGVAGAVMGTRVLQSLLFEVSPTDPVVFATFALVLGGSGWIAAYIPARRATRCDPITTLRYG